MDLPHASSVHTGSPHTQGSAGYTGFTPGSVLLQPSHHAELEAELNYIHQMGERCNFTSCFSRNVPLHSAIVPHPARGKLWREEGKVCSLVQAFTSQAAPKSPIESQLKMNFPGPASKISKDMGCQEINARTARIQHKM